MVVVVDGVVGKKTEGYGRLQGFMGCCGRVVTYPKDFFFVYIRFMVSGVIPV